MIKILQIAVFIALVLIIYFLIPMVFAIAYFIAKLFIAIILGIILFSLGRLLLKRK
jgi:hypothetical protein